MSWFWDKKDHLGLARFVIDSKDSASVKSFIEKAVQSSHLPKSEYDFHQAHNDGRRQLIEKIYNALRQNEVGYARNEYHESSGDRQCIRTPEEIFDTQRKGTCLDLAILFCAICWYYDLLPILILVEGHALVAVSLTHSLRDWENEERRGQQLFWKGLGKLTDSDKLRKMVKRGDYLAIECTGFAESETLYEGEDEKFQRLDGFLSFNQAVELGCKQLTRSLKFALDVHIAYNFWWSKVICQNRLEAETPKRLINNPLTNGENPLLKLYVPLELIERKPDAQRRPYENASPPEASPFNQPDAQYEVVREYNNEEFFEEVLKHKSSSRSQGKRLAIVGDPGGGKTTLLQRIAYWVLEEEQGLPIWISLANVNKNWVGRRDETNEGWLYRYLSENWLRDAAGKAKRTPEKWQQTFEELIESGQVWLLLDGADEMALRHPLPRLKEQLTKGWAKSVRVVLSCRLNLWEEEKDTLRETFDIYRTLEFNYPDQVHQFINNWFGEYDSKAKELQKQLEEDNQKRIQDLVKNPLRLALLCRVWKEGLGALPNTKADFYQLLVENHYKWKGDSTNEEFDIPKDRKKQLNRALGQLAREAIDSESSRFRLRESFIRKFLKDPNDKDSLFWSALKLGWLIHVGYPTEGEINPGEKVYAFVHPTFQEYFAATVDVNYDFFLPIEHRDRPIKNKDNPDKYKRYRIFERQWKEAILLWLGRSEGVDKEQKEEFIKALVEFEDGCGKFYGYQAYFLAAAGIAEFSDCNRADEIVKQIVKWSEFNTSFRPEARQALLQAARKALRETQRARAINALVEQLKTAKEKSIPWGTISSLEKIGSGNQDAINALVKLLKTAHNELTRGLAAVSLERIDPGNQDAINTLIELLKTAHDEYTRILAAESLEKLEKINPGNQDAINALIELLKTAHDEDTRRRAAESLEKIGSGNQDAINALLELLKTAESEYRRWQAAKRLGKIDPGNQDAINALIELLKTAHDEDTRRQAAKRLGKIDPGNQDAINALIELLKTAHDEDTRRQAAESLGKIDPGNQDAINTLIELLKTAHDEDIRRRAAESLGKIDPGNQDAINALIELLKTAHDEYTRRQAAESLEKLEKFDPGDQDVINALLELLKTEDYLTCLIAAKSLEKIGSGNQDAINALLELLKTAHNEYTRWLIAESLGKIDPGNQDAINALLELLKTAHNEYIPGKAAESLEKIDPGNQDAINTLVELFKTDQNEFSRSLRVMSLMQITQGKGLRLVVSGLKSGLTDGDKENNFERYQECDELIWHCMQNMTYPAFYQAWHQQEGVDKTTTANSQSLTQADLQEKLQSAIANDPQLSQIIHLICIDTSKFIDPNNPAAKIYVEMIKQGCSKSDEGTPKTMQDLQVYWDLLTIESDRTIVLMFYQNPSAEARESFSPTFLTNLSKFEGAICVITEQPFDNINLKFFTPSQPIEDVVEWIRAIAMEQ
ncbi:MAG TPA: HEAT repeat domain-containing protein [Waterburya sp.]